MVNEKSEEDQVADYEFVRSFSTRRYYAVALILLVVAVFFLYGSFYQPTSILFFLLFAWAFSKTVLGIVSNSSAGIRVADQKVAWWIDGDQTRSGEVKLARVQSVHLKNHDHQSIRFTFADGKSLACDETFFDDGLEVLRAIRSQY